MSGITKSIRSPNLIEYLWPCGHHQNVLIQSPPLGATPLTLGPLTIPLAKPPNQLTPEEKKGIPAKTRCCICRRSTSLSKAIPDAGCECGHPSSDCATCVIVNSSGSREIARSDRRVTGEFDQTPESWRCGECELINAFEGETGCAGALDTNCKGCNAEFSEENWVISPFSIYLGTWNGRVVAEGGPWHWTMEWHRDRAGPDHTTQDCYATGRSGRRRQENPCIKKDFPVETPSEKETVASPVPIPIPVPIPTESDKATEHAPEASPQSPALEQADDIREDLTQEKGLDAVESSEQGDIEQMEDSPSQPSEIDESMEQSESRSISSPELLDSPSQLGSSYHDVDSIPDLDIESTDDPTTDNQLSELEADSVHEEEQANSAPASPGDVTQPEDEVAAITNDYQPFDYDAAAEDWYDGDYSSRPVSESDRLAFVEDQRSLSTQSLANSTTEPQLQDSEEAIPEQNPSEGSSEENVPTEEFEPQAYVEEELPEDQLDQEEIVHDNFSDGPLERNDLPQDEFEGEDFDPSFDGEDVPAEDFDPHAHVEDELPADDLGQEEPVKEPLSDSYPEEDDLPQDDVQEEYDPSYDVEPSKDEDITFQEDDLPFEGEDGSFEEHYSEGENGPYEEEEVFDDQYEFQRDIDSDVAFSEQDLPSQEDDLDLNDDAELAYDDEPYFEGETALDDEAALDEEAALDDKPYPEDEAGLDDDNLDSPGYKAEMHEEILDDDVLPEDYSEDRGFDEDAPYEPGSPLEPGIDGIDEDVSQEEFNDGEFQEEAEEAFEEDRSPEDDIEDENSLAEDDGFVDDERSLDEVKATEHEPTVDEEFQEDTQDDEFPDEPVSDYDAEEGEAPLDDDFVDEEQSPDVDKGESHVDEEAPFEEEYESETETRHVEDDSYEQHEPFNEGSVFEEEQLVDENADFEQEPASVETAPLEDDVTSENSEFIEGERSMEDYEANGDHLETEEETAFSDGEDFDEGSSSHTEADVAGDDNAYPVEEGPESTDIPYVDDLSFEDRELAFDNDFSFHDAEIPMEMEEGDMISLAPPPALEEELSVESGERYTEEECEAAFREEFPDSEDAEAVSDDMPLEDDDGMVSDQEPLADDEPRSLEELDDAEVDAEDSSYTEDALEGEEAPEEDFPSEEAEDFSTSDAEEEEEGPEDFSSEEAQEDFASDEAEEDFQSKDVEEDFPPDDADRSLDDFAEEPPLDEPTYNDKEALSETGDFAADDVEDDYVEGEPGEDPYASFDEQSQMEDEGASYEDSAEFAEEGLIEDQGSPLDEDSPMGDEESQCEDSPDLENQESFEQEEASFDGEFPAEDGERSLEDAEEDSGIPAEFDSENGDYAEDSVLSDADLSQDDDDVFTVYDDSEDKFIVAHNTFAILDTPEAAKYGPPGMTVDTSGDYIDPDDLEEFQEEGEYDEGEDGERKLDFDGEAFEDEDLEEGEPVDEEYLEEDGFEEENQEEFVEDEDGERGLDEDEILDEDMPEEQDLEEDAEEDLEEEDLEEGEPIEDEYLDDDGEPGEEEGEPFEDSDGERGLDEEEFLDEEIPEDEDLEVECEPMEEENRDAEEEYLDEEGQEEFLEDEDGERGPDDDEFLEDEMPEEGDFEEEEPMEEEYLDEEGQEEFVNEEGQDEFLEDEDGERGLDEDEFLDEGMPGEEYIEGDEEEPMDEDTEGDFSENEDFDGEDGERGFDDEEIEQGEYEDEGGYGEEEYMEGGEGGGLDENDYMEDEGGFEPGMDEDGDMAFEDGERGLDLDGDMLDGEGGEYMDDGEGGEYMDDGEGGEYMDNGEDGGYMDDVEPFENGEGEDEYGGSEDMDRGFGEDLDAGASDFGDQYDDEGGYGSGAGDYDAGGDAPADYNDDGDMGGYDDEVDRGMDGGFEDGGFVESDGGETPLDDYSGGGDADDYSGGGDADDYPPEDEVFEAVVEDEHQEGYPDDDERDAGQENEEEYKDYEPGAVSEELDDDLGFENNDDGDVEQEDVDYGAMEVDEDIHDYGDMDENGEYDLGDDETERGGEDLGDGDEEAAYSEYDNEEIGFDGSYQDDDLEGSGDMDAGDGLDDQFGIDDQEQFDDQDERDIEDDLDAVVEEEEEFGGEDELDMDPMGDIDEAGQGLDIDTDASGGGDDDLDEVYGIDDMEDTDDRGGLDDTDSPDHGGYEGDADNFGQEDNDFDRGDDYPSDSGAGDFNQEQYTKSGNDSSEYQPDSPTQYTSNAYQQDFSQPPSPAQQSYSPTRSPEPTHSFDSTEQEEPADTEVGYQEPESEPQVFVVEEDEEEFVSDREEEFVSDREEEPSVPSFQLVEVEEETEQEDHRPDSYHGDDDADEVEYLETEERSFEQNNDDSAEEDNFSAGGDDSGAEEDEAIEEDASLEEDEPEPYSATVAAFEDDSDDQTPVDQPQANDFDDDDEPAYELDQQDDESTHGPSLDDGPEDVTHLNHPSDDERNFDDELTDQSDDEDEFQGKQEADQISEIGVAESDRAASEDEEENFEVYSRRDDGHGEQEAGETFEVEAVESDHGASEDEEHFQEEQSEVGVVESEDEQDEDEEREPEAEGILTAVDAESDREASEDEQEDPSVLDDRRDDDLAEQEADEASEVDAADPDREVSEDGGDEEEEQHEVFFDRQDNEPLDDPEPTDDESEHDAEVTDDVEVHRGADDDDRIFEVPPVFDEPQSRSHVQKTSVYGQAESPTVEDTPAITKSTEHQPEPERQEDLYNGDGWPDEYDEEIVTDQNMYSQRDDNPRFVAAPVQEDVIYIHEERSTGPDLNRPPTPEEDFSPPHSPAQEQYGQFEESGHEDERNNNVVVDETDEEVEVDDVNPAIPTSPQAKVQARILATGMQSDQDQEDDEGDSIIDSYSDPEMDSPVIAQEPMTPPQNHYPQETTRNTYFGDNQYSPPLTPTGDSFDDEHRFSGFTGDHLKSPGLTNNWARQSQLTSPRAPMTATQDHGYPLSLYDGSDWGDRALTPPPDEDAPPLPTSNNFDMINGNQLHQEDGELDIRYGEDHDERFFLPSQQPQARAIETEQEEVVEEEEDTFDGNVLPQFPAPLFHKSSPRQDTAAFPPQASPLPTIETSASNQYFENSVVIESSLSTQSFEDNADKAEFPTSRSETPESIDDDEPEFEMQTAPVRSESPYTSPVFLSRELQPVEQPKAQSPTIVQEQYQSAVDNSQKTPVPYLEDQTKLSTVESPPPVGPIHEEDEEHPDWDVHTYDEYHQEVPVNLAIPERFEEYHDESPVHGRHTPHPVFVAFHQGPEEATQRPKPMEAEVPLSAEAQPKMLQAAEMDRTDQPLTPQLEPYESYDDYIDPDSLPKNEELEASNVTDVPELTPQEELHQIREEPEPTKEEEPQQSAPPPGQALSLFPKRKPVENPTRVLPQPRSAAPPAEDRDGSIPQMQTQMPYQANDPMAMNVAPERRGEEEQAYVANQSSPTPLGNPGGKNNNQKYQWLLPVMSIATMGYGVEVLKQQYPRESLPSSGWSLKAIAAKWFGSGDKSVKDDGVRSVRSVATEAHGSPQVSSMSAPQDVDNVDNGTIERSVNMSAVSNNQSGPVQELPQQRQGFEGQSQQSYDARQDEQEYQVMGTAPFGNVTTVESNQPLIEQEPKKSGFFVRLFGNAKKNQADAPRSLSTEPSSLSLAESPPASLVEPVSPPSDPESLSPAPKKRVFFARLFGSKRKHQTDTPTEATRSISPGPSSPLDESSSTPPHPTKKSTWLSRLFARKPKNSEVSDGIELGNMPSSKSPPLQHSRALNKTTEEVRRVGRVNSGSPALIASESRKSTVVNVVGGGNGSGYTQQQETIVEEEDEAGGPMKMGLFTGKIKSKSQRSKTSVLGGIEQPEPVKPRQRKVQGSPPALPHVDTSRLVSTPNGKGGGNWFWMDVYW